MRRGRSQIYFKCFMIWGTDYKHNRDARQVTRYTAASTPREQHVRICQCSGGSRSTGRRTRRRPWRQRAPGRHGTCPCTAGTWAHRPCGSRASRQRVLLRPGRRQHRRHTVSPRPLFKRHTQSPRPRARSSYAPFCSRGFLRESAPSENNERLPNHGPRTVAELDGTAALDPDRCVLMLRGRCNKRSSRY